MEKYKIRDAAKDLNVTPADIIEIVKTFTDTEKKPAAVLTAQEMDIVLEKLTQEHAVTSFDAYYAAGAKAKAEKAAPKPAPVKEKAPAKEKQAAGSKPPVRENAGRTAPSSAPGTALRSGENAPRTAPGSAPRAGENAPRAAQNRPSSQNGQRAGTAVGKPQQSPQNRPASANAPRPAPIPPREKPKAPPKIAPKPIQAAVDVSTLKVNAPPTSKVKGEAVQRGEQVTKRVDTRGTYVELDKYNERYEKIAPQTPAGNRNKNDSFTRKQKINQKSQQNKRGQFGRQRETEAQKLKRLELERARKQQLKVLIPDEIMVSELAIRLKVTASVVIKRLFNLGEMCTINQVIDFDTAALVAEELGAKVEREKIVTIEERLFEEIEDNDENLQERSPVVVVMGHVDHGKTSLLDRIRNASVAEGEAGGITQHIGAYRVKAGGKDITFLDTPGHEAFTSMRARGASITDIAILVVAADDGIMPQTIEAINHAKEAGVAIIIAINKIDKEGANPEKIKQELTEHGLVIEEWGGDIICREVSAKQGIGIDQLLEMVNLTAEMQELRANPLRLAVGTVIEAQLDKGRGPVATVLVQKGTLRTGDTLIAGMAVGRVRVMRDDRGHVIKEAGPSVPVEIMGLAEVPSAGDSFAVVADEKLARELVEKRKHEAKEEQFKLYQKVTLDTLFTHIEDGSVKELPIIVKADVQGSVEAVRQSLEKLTNGEVRVRVIHGGVGAVSESDVMLANASNAIIIGFNVRPHPAAAETAKREGVDVRLYRIIYDAIEEVQTAMKGMLAPKYREVDMARIEVRNVFKITNVGVVAGCYVLDGKVSRHCEIRVVRDGIVISADKIDSLKRFKDDVKDVAQGYECGISLDKFSDIKEGDIFEAFIVEEYRD